LRRHRRGSVRGTAVALFRYPSHGTGGARNAQDIDDERLRAINAALRSEFDVRHRTEFGGVNLGLAKSFERGYKVV
jgi:hypothetical protein